MLRAIEEVGEPLGRFAAELLTEVAADRDVLQRLADAAGAGSSPLEDAVATLALGILGKRALWRALAAIAGGDARLQGFDFGALAQRAQAQHDLVEARRLEFALRVFQPVSA